MIVILRALIRASFIATIAAIAVHVLLACGETESPASATEGPPRRTPTSSEPEREASSRDPDTIDVALEVRTDLGEPIIGRPVLLLDARGKSKEWLTDEGGLAHFARVLPPYDLAVASAPSGIMLVPTIVIGLSRRDPVLELFERDGATTRPAAESIRLAVAPPPCPVSSCFLTVASGSQNGSGTTSHSYSGSPRPLVLTFDHEWSAAVLAKDETIDVHVLTGDSARTAYAYARHQGLSVTPGETRDLGTIAPAPIKATEETPIASRLPNLEPEGAWGRTLMTWLDLPGGGSIALSFVETNATRMRFPLLPIPGSSVRVEAWAQHPVVEGVVPFHHSAHARTGARPVTGEPIDIELALGPTTLRPTLDGNFSRRGVGFEWSAQQGTFLHQLTISDLGRGRMRYRIFLAGSSLNLGHLESLGMPKLVPGPHLLDLTTTTGLVPDDVVSPDTPMRRRVFDRTKSAQISYQRLGFTVTR